MSVPANVQPHPTTLLANIKEYPGTPKKMRYLNFRSFNAFSGRKTKEIWQALKAVSTVIFICNNGINNVPFYVDFYSYSTGSSTVFRALSDSKIKEKWRFYPHLLCWRYITQCFLFLEDVVMD